MQAITTGSVSTGAAQVPDSDLPEYCYTLERDRDNNPVTRMMTGSAVSRVQGISVTASEYRDGRGAISYVTSVTRPGFQSARFEAPTWQEAFRLGAAHRRKFL